MPPARKSSKAAQKGLHKKRDKISTGTEGMYGGFNNRADYDNWLANQSGPSYDLERERLANVKTIDFRVSTCPYILKFLPQNLL
jgi:hypothetical protein